MGERMSFGKIIIGLGIVTSLSASEHIPPVVVKTQEVSIYKESKEGAKIFLFTMLSVFGYGILNDQVTARICLEYFTRGFHEAMMLSWNGPFLGLCQKILLACSSSPTIVAIVWGIVATFIIAVAAAVIITLVSRLGGWPKLTAKDIKYPILGAMGVTGVGALIAGIKGYSWAQAAGAPVIWANQNVAAANLVKWYACAYAHYAAYAVGPIAIVGVCGWILYRRYYLKKAKLAEKNK